MNRLEEECVLAKASSKVCITDILSDGFAYTRAAEALRYLGRAAGLRNVLREDVATILVSFALPIASHILDSCAFLQAGMRTHLLPQLSPELVHH